MKVRKLAVAAALAALMGVLEALGVGIFYLPPIGFTILHIPVLIGTLTEGLGVGLFLGAWFGVQSMLSAYLKPNVLSFCFQNPLVAVLPRLLIPVCAWAVHKLMQRKLSPENKLGIAVASAAGSLANTIFVLSGVMLLYGPYAAQALGIQLSGLVGWALGIGLTQGLPEAAASVILCIAIVPVLQMIRKPKGEPR